jgi:hypothetical protein
LLIRQEDEVKQRRECSDLSGSGENESLRVRQEKKWIRTTTRDRTNTAIPNRMRAKKRGQRTQAVPPFLVFHAVQKHHEAGGTSLGLQSTFFGQPHQPFITQQQEPFEDRGRSL